MKFLDLQRNGLTDVSVILLEYIFKDNNKLIEIYLGDNNITYKGVTALEECVMKNNSLEILCL